LLGDAHPRQISARLAQLIAQPREFLFFGEKLPARFYPLFWRYDLMIGHAHFSNRDLSSSFTISCSVPIGRPAAKAARFGPTILTASYHYLDLVPKGRDEAGLPHKMAWVRLRDQYGS
jgi:hypothetical protein